MIWYDDNDHDDDEDDENEEGSLNFFLLGGWDIIIHRKREREREK